MFEGVYTALVTPFRDGVVDERTLDELVEQQVAAGVDGLVPCGSTGEAATLSHAEHRRVIEVVVAAARGRVRVLAGTGSNSTAEAIELTLHAKEAGADGAILISPYYNRPTPEGIVQHYAAVARETCFPLVVYNIPGRTASNILPATFARLAEIEQVVGVKESCGDLHQVAQLIAATPGLQGALGRRLGDAADDGARRGGGDLHRIERGARATWSSWCAPSAPVTSRAPATSTTACCRCSTRCSARRIRSREGGARDARPDPEELRLPLVRISDPNRARLQLALKEFGLL